MATLVQIVQDPGWLPVALDRASGAIRFARLDRAALAREAFLDERMAKSATEWADAPLAGIADALAAEPTRPMAAFLFHTSFCCSTLLARALDAPGAVLALKEPNILLDLANHARADERWRRGGELFGQAATAIFRLLSRPFPQEARILIKPTNAANSLLVDVIAAGAPALLLYGKLEDYLISILKKGEEGRAFVRGQFGIFRYDGGGLSAISDKQAFALTDLQVAALVWRHQIEAFARILAGRQAASLDYRRLLEDPARTLKQSARWLGLPIADAALDAAAKSDIFATDAKAADRRFDSKARAEEETALAERWKDELKLIGEWAKTLHLGTEAALPLGRALS